MASLDDLTWPVRTDRLLLRRATPDDAARTWPYRRLPEVAEWLPREPSDLAAYTAFYRTPPVLEATVIVERDGVVVGDLYLQVKDAWTQVEVADAGARTEAELGWVVAPEHQGRGYAAEAVAALLALCFEGLGLRRVTAGCFVANEPSWRLMERLGMRREAHTVQDGLHRVHGWMDGFTYAVLAEEWAARP